MTIRHGLFSKVPSEGHFIDPENRMQFRYGIHGIFYALKTGAFLRGTPEAYQAAQLEHHTRAVCERFLFSLQHLNCLLPQLKQMGISGQHFSGLPMELEASCHGDHVLSYLNSLVDDVALLILLATGHPISKAADSMGKFRHEALRNAPALAPVRHLLLELDEPGGWWDLAFLQQTGARQSIIHNQHLVKFHVTTSEGQGELFSLLQSPFSRTTTRCSDFLGLIRNVLTSLFDWLDRLEAALTTHMRSRDANWLPPTACYSFTLPIGLLQGVTVYEKAYFPVPLCDGSDPLPWQCGLTIHAN